VPATATYVYGVLGDSPELPAGPGIAGADLRLVPADGLSALVSDLGEGELRLGREAMATHAQVLDNTLATGTVLPMRFGVVMVDDDAVRRDLLEAHHDELTAQLQELAGKVELRVRATYDEQELMREIVNEDREIARIRESLRGAPEDATYYGRIRLGEMVGEAVQRKRTHDAQRILDRLTPLSLAVEIGEPVHERIVLNASFLVEQARIEEFDEAVDDVGREQAGRMQFKYTGPLPPHSFVELATAA
jgi:hypothetical protein